MKKIIEGGFICVNCGKVVHRIKGSMKHPYCYACFDEIWDGDMDKYIIWLAKTHP